MKIRTDFVTNSSSSSFVTVRLYSDTSMVQYESPDIYWEDDAMTKMLKKLTKYYGIYYEGTQNLNQ